MLAEEYDVVLVGTNLTLSILAAALARNGLRVLCLDDAEQYGGDFATLTIKEMHDFLSRPPMPQQQQHAQLDSKLNIPLPGKSNAYFGLEMDGDDELQEYRASDFGLDLTSKVVFARGLAVDVLAESGVARYLEFQLCDACYFVVEDELQEVPHSKSQVFATNALSMLEKRQLMRFLQFAMDFSNNASVMPDWINDKTGAAAPGRALVRPQNKSNEDDLVALVRQSSSSSSNVELTLDAFLQTHMRMGSAKMRSLIQHGLAESIPECRAGMEKIARYLASLGRFSNSSTPFLHVTYGVSELCQAFSRMCSVYGGTCALRMRPECIDRTSGALVLEDGTRVRAARCTIVQASYLPGEEKQSFTVRMICIAREHASSAQARGKSFIVVPPVAQEESAVFAIRVDASTKLVPRGLFMLHLTVMDADLARGKQRLQDVAAKLVPKLGGDGDGQVLYKCMFAKREWSGGDAAELEESAGGKPVYIVRDRAAEREMQIDACFAHARDLFRKICGETAAFLPASESELRARQEELEASAAVMPGM